MKIACVLIDHLPVKAELRRRAELCGKPVIIVQSRGASRLVLDCSPDAVEVTAGMPLEEALSRYRSAVLLQSDEPYYQRVFDRIVESLTRKSPIVEKAELGCAYVGLDGLEAMYGGEARLIASLLQATPGDLNPRLGLASDKFPAYVAAVTGREGGATRVPDDVAGFLSKFPVSLLPMSWENRVRVHRFGLHTIGHLAALPVGSVQAQFGPEGRIAWELANGIDRSPLLLHGRERSVSEYLTFPSPATTLHAILPAIETLLGRAFAHPEIKGKYVRSASIESQVLRRAPWTTSFAFKDVVDSKDKALLPLRAMLETAKIPGPLEDMRLILSRITSESGIQSSLFSDVRKRVQLRETMRQLEERLRARPPVYRVMDVEPWSRLPERRQALVQFEP